MSVRQAALLVSSMATPTHEDWRVHVWYRAWNGKDKKRSIAVCTKGEQLTEAQAVEKALNSLKKTLMEQRNGKPAWFWAQVPKVYDVKAEPFFKHGTAKTVNRFSEMLARFKATA